PWPPQPAPSPNALLLLPGRRPSWTPSSYPNHHGSSTSPPPPAEQRPRRQARCSNTTPTQQNRVCAAQRPYSGDRVPIICGSPARSLVAAHRVAPGDASTGEPQQGAAHCPIKSEALNAQLVSHSWDGTTLLACSKSPLTTSQSDSTDSNVSGQASSGMLNSKASSNCTISWRSARESTPRSSSRESSFSSSGSRSGVLSTSSRQ